MRAWQQSGTCCWQGETACECLLTAFNETACSADMKHAVWSQPESMRSPPTPTASQMHMCGNLMGCIACCGRKHPLVSLPAVTGLIQFNLLPTQSHGNLLLFGLTTAIVVSNAAFSASLPRSSLLHLGRRLHALAANAGLMHSCTVQLPSPLHLCAGP